MSKRKLIRGVFIRKTTIVRSPKGKIVGKEIVEQTGKQIGKIFIPTTRRKIKRIGILKRRGLRKVI